MVIGPLKAPEPQDLLRILCLSNVCWFFHTLSPPPTIAGLLVLWHTHTTAQNCFKPTILFWWEAWSSLMISANSPGFLVLRLLLILTSPSIPAVPLLPTGSCLFLILYQHRKGIQFVSLLCHKQAISQILVPLGEPVGGEGAWLRCKWGHRANGVGVHIWSFFFKFFNIPRSLQCSLHTAL